MNYYEHHIGDYAAATAHLSLIEDAVYSRMLRRYYLTESPLPVEWRQVARIVGARAEDELQAVQDVLAEFFVLADDGWHQKRCDENIATFHERQGDREAEREHEAERKRRYRERRSELFDHLRDMGVIPPFNTTTDELVRMLSHGTRRGQDGDGTATQSQSQSQSQTPQEQKPVQRAAARFAEFWAVYPVKKGKAAAEKVWKARSLDALADQLIAHVRRMQAEDDDWRRGYVPHGSTYIAGERWHDEPKRRTTGPPQASAPSKTLSAIQKLEGMKHGLADTRTDDRLPKTPLLGFGPDACD